MGPLIAMIASALLKDGEARKDANQAKLATLRDYQQQMRERQTNLMGGGNPYDRLHTGMDQKLGAIQRAKDEGTNNAIGSLLQSYLLSSGGKGKGTAAEAAATAAGSGSGTAAPTYHSGKFSGEDSLGNVLDLTLNSADRNIASGRMGDFSGYGDQIGVNQEDPWDKDPWGDAGF